MRQRSGIALISGMLFVLLIAMVVTAAISLAPGALLSSQAYLDNQSSVLAAQSGLEYARTRMRENVLWRGGEAGPIETVSSPDGSLTVVEDHGNVVGILRAPDGNYCRFRIRFNHQNVNAGLDGLDNPSPGYRLDLPFISRNNLTGSAGVETYEERAGTVVVAGEPLSAFQGRVIVEGQAGPALGQLSPAAPHPPLSSGRLVCKRLSADLRCGFGQTA